LISVVVPLQHFSPLAEKVLARAIRAKTDVQLIIVTDNDAAQQLLEQKYGAACVVNIHPLRGRGYAICAGIKRAKHEMVLVLHGDTVLPDNWAEAVASTLRKGYVGGGFSLSFAPNNLYLSTLARLGRLYYRITKEIWGDRGGFFYKPAIEAELDKIHIPIMEDIILSQLLQKKGKTKIVSAKVVTDSSKFYQKGMLSHIIYIFYLRGLFLFGVSPDRIYDLYYPDKKRIEQEAD
jgi:glycosyltransferase involved in cell wall biosynthesis